MRIERIIQKNGTSTDLGKISILVGANNVGKSQTLRDIHQRMQNGSNSKFVLLKEIVFQKPESFEDLLTNIEVSEIPHNPSNRIVTGINSTLTGQDRFEIAYDILKQQFNDNNVDGILGNIAKFKVSHLDSSTRLRLVTTTNSFDLTNESPANILQNLFKRNENEAFLKSAFKEAFEMEVMLDYSAMKNLCLRVAKNIPPISEDPREAYSVTKDFSKIDDQGDGFKSFVGIILSILFSGDRIVLLDEPEAFLHPAQARYLGKWIADNSDKLSGQIIIATHNSHFLQGLLQGATEVNIFRLNRNDDDTTFNLIPPNATNNLAQSPMLASQRVLEAIFHKAVVVCEADADRIVYQTISTSCHNNQEILFVHSHNKQTLGKVASLLDAAQIPVGVIVDIDILNDENEFKNLFSEVTNEAASSELLENRNEIAKSVDKIPEQQVLDKLKDDVSEFLDQLKNNKHTLDGARGALNRIKKDNSKWDEPKKKGINGFDEAIVSKVKDFIEELNNKKIFIVPVGGLEGWMDLGTTKKNKWIVSALDTIFAPRTPEQEQILNPLTDFIKMVLTKVKKVS